VVKLVVVRIGHGQVKLREGRSG